MAQRVRVQGTVLPAHAVPAQEGLRERKKRETRQQISDTATQMFLEQGFDEVRVADVAAACGVSEKTIYNYFPTKESLLLDREESMVVALQAALGPDTVTASPIEAVVHVLVQEVADFFEGAAERGGGFTMFWRFTEMLDNTPSLRAAHRDMMDRLAQVAAHAMAERAGVDPLDPEPQIAAAAIMGLYDVQFRAIKRQAEIATSMTKAQAAIVAEVKRAARLIETGLWSFSMVVQGQSGLEQLKQAGEAAGDARKQVILALRLARDGWKHAIREAQREAQQGHRELEQAMREATRRGTRRS